MLGCGTVYSLAGVEGLFCSATAETSFLAIMSENQQQTKSNEINLI